MKKFRESLFNFETFDIKLDTEFIGRNFIYSEEVESTNSFLLNNAEKLDVNGTVLLAEKQTRGKGRNNSIWHSNKEQNLTFSILLTDKKYFEKFFNIINFATSLAVSQAIENIYQLRTELKWPNDILINHKKVAGILLESSSKGSKISKLVIGIGVNVNQTLFQGNFNIAPTSLKNELSFNVEREKTLAEILNIFESNIEKSLTKPDDILKDWKLKCRMIGEIISISADGHVKDGIFVDLDNEGFLLLKTRDKIEKIHFGEVSLL